METKLFPASYQVVQQPCAQLVVDFRLYPREAKM